MVCQIAAVLVLGLVAVGGSFSAHEGRAATGPLTLRHSVGALTSDWDRVVVATFGDDGFVRLVAYGWDGRVRGRVPYHPHCGDGEVPDGGPASVVLGPISGGAFTVDTSPNVSSNFWHRSLSLQGSEVRSFSCGPLSNRPSSIRSAVVGAGRVLLAITHEGAPRATRVLDAHGNVELFSVSGSDRLISVTPTRVLLDDGFEIEAVDLEGHVLWQKPFQVRSFLGAKRFWSTDASTLALATESTIELVSARDGSTIASWPEPGWSCDCIAVGHGYVAWLARNRVYVRALRGSRSIVLATLPGSYTPSAISAGPRGLIWAGTQNGHGAIWLAPWSEITRRVG